MNCNLTYLPVPARNITGPPDTYESDQVPINGTSSTCPQIIEAEEATSTCEAFSTKYGVPTATLRALNDHVYCPHLSGPYCAPLRCPVAQAYNSTSCESFADQFQNITCEQFLSWNPYIGGPSLVTPGDMVCIG